MSANKYQEIRCNQTGMAQNASIEASKATQSYHSIILMEGMTEAMSSFEFSPSSQSYHHMPKAACGLEFSIHSPIVNTVNPHDFVIDYYGRRRKRTESDIIGELQKQINELKFEVSLLKKHENSDIKIHYIEIVDLPFEEVKTQVLDYYNEHGETYPDDIATELRLDFKTVMKAVEELIQENKLQLAFK